MSEWYPTSYWSHWRSTSSAQVHETEAEPDKFNFLSFLAIAQALQIEFLPIVKDLGQEAIGIGGTSTIHESLVNVDTSFAFKVHHKRGMTEDQVFRNLINEVIVSSQVFIRSHASIAQLRGISWDVSADDDKPWPVLVFQKSHFGDLHHFAMHGGRDMTVVERLDLCLDIGRAIEDMHCNKIVHGDIKPENVLVFKGMTGRFNAKVIDFGYSSRYIDRNQYLLLARSEPWNAPENDGRQDKWTLSEAVKADMFCFGMLCLWLLFEPRISGGLLLLPNLEVVDIELPRPAEDTLRIMKGKLKTYASYLLSCDTGLRQDQNMALQEFFDSSLSHISNERQMSLRMFLEKMDPQRRPLYQEVITTTSEYSLQSSDFKIEGSIFDFYITDYRVRSYIAQCLLDHYSQSAPIAIQAALCYYIGFGVKRDEAKTREILLRNNQKIQRVKDIASVLCQRRSEFPSSSVSELRGFGHFPRSDFAYLYFDQERIDQAEVQLTQETDDLTIVFGGSHALTVLSKDILGGVYFIQGRIKEAETVLTQVAEIRKTTLGLDHPSTLASMVNLAISYWSQHLWEESEKLLRQVIETCTLRLGADHPNTLETMATLASILWSQHRLEDSEKLELQVMEIRRAKLEADHPELISSMGQLELMYAKQERWEEAEKLSVQLTQIYKNKLGVSHPITLGSMDELATIYTNQSKWEDAEKLEILVVETYKTKLGADHPSTLTSMANLALIYKSQGRLKEAEKLLRPARESCSMKLKEVRRPTRANLTALLSTLRKIDQLEFAKE